MIVTIKRGRKWLMVGSLIAIALAAFWGGVAFAQTPQSHADSVALPAYELDKVTPIGLHGDVRHLWLIEAPQRQYFFLRRLTPPPTSKSEASADSAAAPDVSVVSPPLAPMPSPTQNFAGLNFADLCGGTQCGAGWPPDANGDVGPNHYVQAVNDAYAIYSKTGTLLASFTENQLWSGAGTTPCNGNGFGDPVVLYDQLADRWILTHVAYAVSGGTPVSPFYQCVAVSQTGDPVSGGWWLYALRMDPGGTGLPPVGTLNDYPRFGIWPDCLYMATNGFQFPAGNFTGTSFASLSRSDLYSGATLTWGLGFINNATDPYTMIPSNLLGRSAAALPPPGTPNYFVSESQTAFAFEVRKFTAGPNCGGGGVLSTLTNVSQTSYTVAGATIVPQPGTSAMLDSLPDLLMQKVQYRRVGSAESLWVVHTVQTSSTSTVRPQWAQLDVTGGVINTTPVQQQIYAPDTTLHRWTGSLAVDSQGNMALGYSTSNGTAPNFPSIAYSGRLATDPLNSLPQSEVQLVAGAASQTNTCGGSPCSRWGDYSAMSVDPADDCTFWYTNQYYSSAPNGASGNWQTRIGSFKYPSCTSSLPPLATTYAANNVAASTATVNGLVNPNGLATIALFQWGTTTAYGNATSSQSLGSGTAGIGVSANLTGLVASTTYHYRVVATGSAGTTNGSDGTFTTNSPWTVTLSASNTTVPVGTSVILTAMANQGVGPTPYYILILDGATILRTCGTGTTCSISVSSSTATTKTYTAKVAALNGSNVQATSSSVSVTWGTAPTATTNAASNVGPTTATLNGAVNPNGAATTVVFQWGPTTSYGNATATQAIGSGTSNVAVTANLTGLTANTTYHYRAVAMNSAGTTNGADSILTTGSAPATPPTATTNAASNITSGTATLNGTVNPSGLATTALFQWGTTTAYGHTTSSQSLGSGTADVSVAANLSGLAANTTYHFRVVATNNAGTTNGSDVTFTTSPITATSIFAAVLPLSRSVQVGGAPATAFASIINAGAATAINCGPAPPSTPPGGLGSFTYQITNAANVPVGTPNTPANIAPGQVQTYVFGLSPTAAIPQTSLVMRFICDNAEAPPTDGVNNFFIVADPAAIPDTIALIATVSSDGIVKIPGSNGTQLFAIGTSNVGATGMITVSADTGSVSLPLTLTVCESNPATGACLASATPTVTVNYTGGTNRSFVFFAQASGSISFLPGTNRVFARLTQSGVRRGATSAAVCTTPNCPVPTTILTGNVAAVGAVTNANLGFFELNADGSKGRSLGTTTTDTSGLYQVTLATAQPVLVVASGGSYVNTANGVTDNLRPTDTLTAVWPKGTTEATVTPLTHMAAARARVLAASGVSLATAVAAANIGVAQQYLLTDILGVLPVDANDAARVAAASRDQRNYGIVLAGIGREALTLNVRPIDLAVALAEDMADGVLDGLGFLTSTWMGAGVSPNVGLGTPQVIPLPTISGTVVDLPVTAGTATLQQAINVFLASQLNLTNLAGKNIGSTPIIINPQGGTFYIAATALPAWLEGNPGSAPITIVGGTPPYSCAVTPGSALPSWLALVGSPATGWALAGTAPVLPGGSTMRIEPPFSVTCSDSTPAANGGPLRQAVQWTVTIVKAPPTLVPVPGFCVAGTPNVDILIATATGGVPPYYFRSPSFAYGAPPLGMTIAPNGHLRGNCPAAGVFGFPVIVVDSIGADPPQDTSLTVCTASIAPTSQSFGASGGNGSVTVTTSVSGCVWKAASNASWITITASSPDTGTVSYSVAANTDTTQHTGTLTIAGQTFTVTQDSASCTFSIAPTSQSFGSAGGTGSVTVTASNGCTWTAVSNDNWITITGSGNGSVSYSVATNTGTTQRTGTLTIAGKTFTVTESAPSSSCQFTGSMTGTWSSSACHASGTFSVTINAACSVSGSYSGNASGGISGSVNASGTLAAGTTGGGTWNGTVSTNGTTLSGSGTFSDSGCSGQWHSTP